MAETESKLAAIDPVWTRIREEATQALDQQSVGRLSRMDAIQQQAMAKATQSRHALGGGGCGDVGEPGGHSAGGSGD